MIKPWHNRHTLTHPIPIAPHPEEPTGTGLLQGPAARRRQPTIVAANEKPIDSWWMDMTDMICLDCIDVEIMCYIIVSYFIVIFIIFIIFIVRKAKWCCKYHSLCTCWHRWYLAPILNGFSDLRNGRGGKAAISGETASSNQLLKACWVWNLAEPSEHPTLIIYDFLWESMTISPISNISFIFSGEPDSKLSPQRAPLAAGYLIMLHRLQLVVHRSPSVMHIPTPTRPHKWIKYDRIKCTIYIYIHIYTV